MRKKLVKMNRIITILFVAVVAFATVADTNAVVAIAVAACIFSFFVPDAPPELAAEEANA